MTLTELGQRDGWSCWICGAGVDPAAPPGSSAAPSTDHVLPRAKGGGSTPDNLRLAHRGCNGRRGSRLPELDWPADLAVSAPAPLWPVIQRALRRPGEREVVAFAATAELADRVSRWLSATLTELLGGDWEVEAVPAAGGQLLALRVRFTAGARGVPRRL